MVMLGLALLGCQPAPVDDVPVDTTPAAEVCTTAGRLAVVPLDAWGRDLPGASVVWDARPDAAAGEAPSEVVVPFGDASVTLRGRLSAEDHVDATLSAAWDGAAFTLAVDGAVGHARSEAVTQDALCGEVPTTTLYVLLDHAWLSAQARAPSHSRAELFTDGEDQWAQVDADLQAVTRRVTWSTWWWESDFELLRPAAARERAQHTAMALMQALPDVDRRLLINRFWAENADWTALLNTDTPLRDAADAPDDRLEVMLQGNATATPVYEEYTGGPAPIDVLARVAANPRYADREVAGPGPRRAGVLTLDVASWHQKAMVFDGEVAWVTGMNTRQNDWDTSEHLVFDARRMNADADADARADVTDELSLADNLPRKDYGVRLEGPAARDVEDVLHSRWSAALDEDALYAENATPFDLDPAPAAPADGVLVQVVATMPEPWADQSIFETHAKAIRQARSYIYIEDQYFRAPRLNQVIVEAMDANPELVLIVMTQAVGASDGGSKYTYLSDALFRQRYPDRYLLVQPKTAELTVDVGLFSDTAEVVVQDVNLHSKLRFVDDRYVSVGSCNMNNRGYLYEGELDVSVLDAGFATDSRRRVFSNLVGPAWAAMLSDDARNNFDVLAMAAEANAETLAWWEQHADDYDDGADAEAEWAARKLSGFVVPLVVEPDYFWDVGPDAF